jgi:hypothetical protein
LRALLLAQWYQLTDSGLKKAQADRLKVPQRWPKRGRLWLADGSCVGLRPKHANHVWAYDFVEDRTREGRQFRMLRVVDECRRETLATASAANSDAACRDRCVLGRCPANVRSKLKSLATRSL